MHRFIPEPGDEGTFRPDPGHTEAIKRWTREYLKLGEEVAVHVTESACADPGCPVLETVVAVFPEGEAPRVFRFQRPRVAVTKIMIQTALRG